jgi:hypothetical protein
LFRGSLATNVGSIIIGRSESTSIQIGHLKLEVTPAAYENRGEIMLAIKVYEKIDGEFSLRAEPKVTTADNREAVIRTDSASGHNLIAFLTPSIQ